MSTTVVTPNPVMVPVQESSPPPILGIIALIVAVLNVLAAAYMALRTFTDSGALSEFSARVFELSNSSGEVAPFLAVGALIAEGRNGRTIGKIALLLWFVSIVLLAAARQDNLGAILRIGY